MEKSLSIIWYICCELFGVNFALIPKYIFAIILLLIFGIATHFFSWLKKKEQTRQIAIMQSEETKREIRRLESHEKEVEIIKDMSLGIATATPMKSEEIKKQNNDNLICYQSAARKRVEQIILDTKNDADKSLPAYYENLKEDIDDDIKDIDYKSILQLLKNKDDGDED